jgi:sulfite reductase (ferredoxin)
MADQPVDLSEPISKVEKIKEASNHLRGTIAEELVQDTATFSDESVQLLKFHGVYQQEDRDLRKQARSTGGGRHHMMMIRTRVPGGRVSPDGYLAHDDIARRWGNGTLRITTREAFQLHGVLKGNLRRSIRAINDALMTTLGGCGDQERNIMCCPAPIGDQFRTAVSAFLDDLVPALTPRTGAYHEIWVDGEVQQATPAGEHEDLYGERYLPRKFKTAIAFEGDNCVDAYANDLALVVLREGDQVAGVNLLAGGGLGRTNNKPDTFPAVARSLGFVRPDRAIAAARAIVAVQRDHGNRADRRHARLKYLIHERGIEWFRAAVEAEAGFELGSPRPVRWDPVDDHLGWHPQAGGGWCYGLYIENGRIGDAGERRLATGMRAIVDELRPTVHLTPQQNLIVSGLDDAGRTRFEELLAEYGIATSESYSATLRHAMACPAMPTCGLAVAESERVLPSLIREVETVIAELGLQDERISYRMTGCPNGCARPYLGDVGFVGTTLGKYDVFLGGDFDGTRLNTLFARNVPFEELPGLLRGPLREFRDRRQQGEGFGDWCHRVGVEELASRHLEAVSA